ncbi:protein kinase domain containing protein [Stylonychia lemnae]|uniref:Protein kinase domain containing protein n=1 Tax=Stylonychia lemnae TaxID=5949 RepID=A0A078AP99_STYLE|nr:protein kinase domain containing protein [Stylonychia lemnae]|eukprot:CDW83147.1 protein kinase domain containing protein [Stylonychia lemnae]
MKTQDLNKLITKIPRNYSNEIIRLFREINTFNLCHPNITKFFESYFTFDDQFVIITELAENDLKSYRQANSRITNDKIMDIMVQIMRGTNYLHNQNIMHRDLSPDNILVFDNGTKFKLCDFGLATPNGLSIAYTGKLYFKAPEINQDEEYSYNHQVDIWSAGVILYYLCTEEYSKIFETLLNKMLRYKPLDRPQALEVLSDLYILMGKPLNNHIEEEEKGDDQQQKAFSITLQSTNEKYQGEIDQSTKKPDGRGRLLYPKGSIQEGVWKDNQLNGREINSIGNYYIGELKDFQCHGYGKRFWDDGDFYEGYFINDNIEGLGLYKWSNDTQCYGQWSNGMLQGLGVFISKNGNIQVGQFIKGENHGISMIIPKDGSQIMIKRFENNKCKETLLKVDNKNK